MNSPRRSFLRRALGMAVAAPAITRLIANGGPAPKPVSLPPAGAPRLIAMSSGIFFQTPCRAMTRGAIVLDGKGYEVARFESDNFGMFRL
jgi:hypothetical protein